MPLPPYLRLDGGRMGLRVLKPEGRTRLLAFPYAGGQALAFRPLAAALPEDVALAAVDPPGHGFCAGPARERVEDVVADCLAHVPGEWLDDVVLVGHSYGGYVAMGLAAALAARGRPPRGVVLGATRPPHRRDAYASFAAMDDATLLRTLVAMGGMPSGREAEALFAWGKDALRADFRAFDTFAPPEEPIPAPVLALGAWDDAFVRAPDVREWARWAPGCRVELLSGGHLFLLSQAAEHAARIGRFVAELDGGTGAAAAGA